MKKIIISFVTLVLLSLQSSAYTLKSDSLGIKKNSVHNTSIDTTKDGILLIHRFDDFLDIINETSDSTDFYNWVTDDIHNRKFDFSKVKDSLIVVLNDSNAVYTHPVKGNVTS